MKYDLGFQVFVSGRGYPGESLSYRIDSLLCIFQISNVVFIARVCS